MKKKTNIVYIILLALMIINFQSSIVYANVLDRPKEIANKAMFWKADHLKEISFRTLYPKPIYKKGYFPIIILGSTIVAGGAMTYFTGGAGAPAAATGVGTVASWIGGGGAGSYMAGLSTVGSMLGGNAITGAVILNGLSYGLVGGTMGKFAALSAISKFGVIANVTATTIDGVAILSKSDAATLYYTVRIPIPKNLGSKKTRKLVNEIYENEEKKLEAMENHDETAAIRYKEINDALMKSAEKILADVFKNKNPSQEDILVLGIINYQAGNVQKFQEAMRWFSSNKLGPDKRSYIDYLTAISYLLDGNEKHAIQFLDRSSRQEPYVLESQTLAINILGSNFQKNEDLIIQRIKFMEKHYDDDKYSGQYSLMAPYYRLATIYYNQQKFSQARKFYERALDEIGFIQGLLDSGESLKRQIKLGIVNCYYQQGDKYKANELYTKIIDGLKGDELTNIKALYAGTN
ncbi:MAG TPA: tetratricopeptide repeat protein [Bacilli bacterium]|nr:tetratricopeptide repeat protein [Bacilli bacterium]